MFTYELTNTHFQLQRVNAMNLFLEQLDNCSKIPGKLNMRLTNFVSMKFEFTPKTVNEEFLNCSLQNLKKCDLLSD